MFIIYQRQGFVSSQNPLGDTIQNRGEIFYNAKKDRLSHIFVHFDNQQRGRKFSNECRERERYEATREPSQLRH